MKRWTRFDVILAVIFAFGMTVPVVVSVTACSGVSAAYKAAENPGELAYVLLEHYAALVKAAADLAEKPTTPASAIQAMQRADATAKPVVLKLRPLREAYIATKSATSEADLQLATNQAVLAIADLVRAINIARGVK